MAANDMRVLLPLSSFDRIYENEPGTAELVEISLDLDNYDLETESDDIVDDLSLEFTDAELATELHAGMKPFRDTIVSEIRSYIDEKSGTNELSSGQEEDLNEFIAELERDEPTERFRVLLAGDAFLGLFFGILSEADLGVACSEGLPQLAFRHRSAGDALSVIAFQSVPHQVSRSKSEILFFTFFTFFGSFSVIVGSAPHIPDLRPAGI